MASLLFVYFLLVFAYMFVSKEADTPAIHVYFLIFSSLTVIVFGYFAIMERNVIPVIPVISGIICFFQEYQCSSQIFRRKAKNK
ncbi:hypothetical protein WM1_03119 [Enterococcus faecalis EnGen0341]|nr:hypothetical protein WUI_03167 [Enterococcus faecalis EnGen0335]EOL91591.1 hypothetical protein WM1_03119 [Enterococcus faecalis EnGen0341]